MAYRLHYDQTINIQCEYFVSKDNKPRCRISRKKCNYACCKNFKQLQKNVLPDN